MLAGICLVLAGTLLFLFPQVRQHVPFYGRLRTVTVLLARNPLCSFSAASRNLSLVACPFTKLGMLWAKCVLRTKDADGYEYWETPRGFFWTPPGLNHFAFIFLLAEMECAVYGSPENEGVHSGDFVLDCGAHIGTYTRKALDSGAKLVVAIEPTPVNVVCLQRNFSKEIAEGRVIVYGKGIWNKDETLTFYSSEQTNLNSILQDKNIRTVETRINVTTIDRIVSELHLPRVDFIKMDIEGAEQNALHGAKKSIVKYKPRMAIATEHTEDIFVNAQKVSEIVASINSGYQKECGECNISKKGYLVPFVLFFH